MKEFVNKNIKVIILLFVVIIISVIGVTIAYKMEDIGVTIATGNFGVIYNGNSSISSTTLQPIYDSDLLTSSSSDKIMKIEFGVKGASTNPTDVPLIYDVTLTNLTMPTQLRSEFLKWRLYKNGSQISEGSFSPEFDAIVDKRLVLTNIQQDLPNYNSSTDNYVFYVWISEPCTGNVLTCSSDTDLSGLLNQTFSGEIRIELSTKSKKTLNRMKGNATVTLDKITEVTQVSNKTPTFSSISPIVTYKEISGNSGSSSVDQSTTKYYVTYSSEYEFNEITGTYSLVNPVVEEYALVYKDLIGKYITSTTLSTSSELAVYTNLSTIYYVVDATYDDGISIGVIKFNEQISESDGYDDEDIGIFSSEDEFGTTYYYRGNIQNNYVYFAGFYWRIIRINGDGSIRIIYDGTSAHANGESSTDRQIGKTVFFDKRNDNSFVGYMNGSVDGTNFPSGGTNSTSYEEAHSNLTDSTAKTMVDDWYKTNIVDKGFSSYVVDAVYCADRTTTPGDHEIWSQMYSATGEGYGTYVTMYGMTARADIAMVGGSPVVQQLHPSFKCSREEDKFTVSEELGNGDLTYPVGLITSDEAVYAGGHMNDNYSFYLYTGNYFWTMSPYSFSGGNAYVFSARTGSRIFFGNHLGHSNGIRPVVSLRADSIIDGTGDINDPYIIG